MIVTIRNDFHNTSVQVKVKQFPHVMTVSQTDRVRRELCSTNGCTCGGILHERGPQDVVIIAPHRAGGEPILVEKV